MVDNPLGRIFFHLRNSLKSLRKMPTCKQAVYMGQSMLTVPRHIGQPRPEGNCMDGWFEASKEGLRKLVEDRPKVFIIHELLSNAWDTGCKRVDITLEKVPGKPLAKLSVLDDNPDGFSNLSHAWTLFAESERKVDPETIGRYNMGEKLVLALCEEATITTTTGTVHFTSEGRKNKPRLKRDAGSLFTATVRMTHAEFDEVIEALPRIISRPDVVTTFNGDALNTRDPIATFEATLPTVIGDDGGSLRRTKRKAVVEVYQTRDGEAAGIYELGIPVVDTEDKYHVNVRQKVPLNMDRDNVPPAFLKQVRALVLNNVVEHITKDDATETWVTEAMGSKYVEPVTVRQAVTKRFGEKAAIYDPSDTEANGTLVSRGFQIVHGGTLPKDVWANVKAAEALKPAGQIAPTPKPYSDDPEADPANIMPREKWTPAMVEVAEFAVDLHRELFKADLQVRYVTNVPRFAAAYGSGVLDFFTMRLGKRWFETVGHVALVDLLVHEFAHRFASDHNEEAFHEACTKIAGQVSEITYRIPEFFEFLHDGGR